MEPCEFELQPLYTPGKLNEKKNTPPKNRLRNSELVGSLEVFDHHVFRVKLLVLGGFIDVLLLTLTCEACNLTKII